MLSLVNACSIRNSLTLTLKNARPIKNSVTLTLKYLSNQERRYADDYDEDQSDDDDNEDRLLAKEIHTAREECRDRSEVVEEVLKDSHITRFVKLS